MTIHSKVKLVTLSMIMTGLVMFHATTVNAQGTQTGAQICVPPSFEQLKTLDYGTAGVRNTADSLRWVVCPLLTVAAADTYNSVTRLTNLSDKADKVTCIYRLTNQLGQDVRTITFETEEAIAPNTGVSLITENFPTDFGDTLTVSCNLPPDWRIVSLGVQSIP